MKSNYENDVDLTINIAEMLREVSAQSSSGSQKIIDKANKAARKGLTSIKVKCTEMDHKCVDDRKIMYEGKNVVPLTPLVQDLINYKLHLDTDYDINFFLPGKTYWLIISW